MCKRDPLFYINTFSWTVDPRLKYTVIPMITYGYQDEGLLAVLSAVDHQSLYGRSDRLWEKSRTMGVSWLMMNVLEYKWHFFKMVSFLLASRKEDLVDIKGDTDTLMGKLDFIRENQPGWLVPRVTRNKLYLKNEDNGSLISGESTNGDLSVGGRRTALILDEFALVQNGYQIIKGTRDVSKCRLFVSTPRGVGNAFYAMRKKMIDVGNEKSIIRTHWSQHPIYSRGICERGGKPWSPWYQSECDAAAHPMEISQELDIDYLSSDYQFFDEESLRRMEREYCIAPLFTGELGYNLIAQPKDFEEHEKGRLRVWAPIVNGRMAPGKYAVSADIAVGTGSSNSVISFGTKRDGKLGEMATPYLRPEELARYAVAIARWLGDAYLIWESNGPGRIFGDMVTELGYRNVYYKRNERSLSKKASDIPGWQSTSDSKKSILGEYRRSIVDLTFVNRCAEAINECRHYVFYANGTVAHSDSTDSPDPTGARDNHGDRVMADAMLFKALTAHVRTESESKPQIQPGSYAWRMRERNRKRASVGADAWY